jgi:eukaryotic-like serine/threonine-protein kinase
MTVQSPAEKLVGATLNQRFQIVRLLGEGGMGAVYEADSRRGEGKRAVKLLHEEFVRVGEVRERFLAEAQATRNLVHPNVVPILESAVAEDGCPYLVMELLRGQSLGDRLEGGRILPVPEAWKITSQVLAALSAAHSVRVVHRDLKPDNVFLAQDPGGNEVVKVLDFGIAKVMDAAGGMTNKTRTGALIGTPGYMSPEQIKSAKSVDPRSDLWSVATLLYQMLTGRLPFEADNEFTRLTAVIVGHPTPIDQVNPALARFAPFFLRALAKQPDNRFQTADEMAQALAAIVAADVPGAAASSGWQAPQQPSATLTSAASAAKPHTSHGTTVMNAMSLAGPPSAPQPAPAAGSFAVADTDPAASPRPQAPHAPANILYPPQPSGGTQMSAGVGPASGPTPYVAVVSAPPLRGAGAPWWVVGVVAVACLGLGFLLGFLAGGS